MLKIITTVIMGLVACTATAQPLLILTEEDPLFSHIRSDGKLVGYAVEVVQEIQVRVGSNDPIKIQPWARIIKLIKNNPNVVVFTMSRTIERDSQFQWVGPLFNNKWILVGMKDSKLKIKNLDDARLLKGIGVVRDYAWDVWLTKEGFTNLERVNLTELNVRKLEKNRIQAAVFSEATYLTVIAEAADPTMFEILYPLQTIQLYIVHSKGTDPKIVYEWQKAFLAMKADGTLKRMMSMWLPFSKVPTGPLPLPF